LAAAVSAFDLALVFVVALVGFFLFILLLFFHSTLQSCRSRASSAVAFAERAASGESTAALHGVSQ